MADRMKWIPNPCQRGGRRPVEIITDRAKRYRAQGSNEQLEKRCIYCGAPASSRRRLDVEHIDGKEANGSAANLAYACRSCNTQKGAYFAGRGRGVRTRQFNPDPGARTLAEYMETIAALKGWESRFTLTEAVAKMHATPASTRSRYARDIWERRRARGGDTGVPF